MVNYEVVESGLDEWRVEGIDYGQDGQVYVAVFSGPEAEVRAKEYAVFKEAGRPSCACGQPGCPICFPHKLSTADEEAPA